MDEKTEKAKPAPEPKFKPLSLIDPRDHFIGIALAEIIKDQLSKGKWEHDVAATHAVRYADNVMKRRSTVAQSAVVVAGKPFVPTVVPSAASPADQTQVPASAEAAVPVLPPANAVKSLQEQLEEAGDEPVAEVK